MNLDQLEVVKAIIDQGSFRAAADFLNRSQPALSASIKNLEDEFGIQIFDRSQYRPKLTDVGSIFISAATKTLEASYETSKIARELGQKKTETKIKIAIDPLVPIEDVEVMAQECARPVVPAILILEKTVLHGSHELLLSGKVDLALASEIKDDKNIESIQVATVTLVAAVSRKLLQEKKQADDNFLKNHAQIFVYNKDFDDPPNDLIPNPIYDGGSPKIYVPDHFTKLQLIKNGLGWGRISEAEFEEDPELVLISKKVCRPIVLELCLMKSKYRPLGPIARKIWSVFEKRAANLVK